MAITVKEVAKKAGVATSTVSRVINNYPSISDVTKEHVLRVMTEMGYVPNRAAQNLSKQKANAIGVILPPFTTKERLSNPFFLEVITAINTKALVHNKTTALATANDYPTLLENVKQMHQQRQVDGFIVTYSDQNDPIVAYLHEQGVPFSLIGKPDCHQENIHYVDNDNYLIGQQATQLLLDYGHSNLLFVTHNSHETVSTERYLGYQQVLKGANLKSHKPFSFQDETAAMSLEKSLVENKISGLVVMDDGLALQIMHHLQLAGYQLPQELSVVSVNNSFFATLFSPLLTSFDICVAELGERSVTQLLQILAEPTQKVGNSLVAHHLVVRQSITTKNSV